MTATKPALMIRTTATHSRRRGWVGVLLVMLVMLVLPQITGNREVIASENKGRQGEDQQGGQSAATNSDADFVPYDMRKPRQLDGVEVVEQLNKQVPLDLPFRDWRGNPVKLGEYFPGDKPVILTLNYSDCPMLCNLQLNGLVSAMRQLDLVLGEDYRIVTVSVDPTETMEKAAKTRRQYLEAYEFAWKEPGWVFLRGKEPDIRALANEVGFGYRYVPSRGEYAHAAVTMICTPEGKLSRYLYDVKFDPRVLRLSLVEAAAGEIGTTLDQVILYCFHYDATQGRYGPVAFRIMQVGGISFVALLAVLLIPVWARSFWRLGRKDDPATAGATPETNADAELAIPASSAKGVT